MAGRGVQVAIWSFHRQLLDGAPLEAYITREAKVQVRHFHADNTRYRGLSSNGTILLGKAPTRPRRAGRGS
jgi:hypothetical protein